jgi:glycosyltransferase involved in cell wall biosynthesis
MSSLVSVIIPAYNSSRYIRQAIESVFNQTHQNTEAVVVDDGSSDNTRELVSSLVPNRRLKYLYQENKGPAAARNAGIRGSTGAFIAFLDADDFWLPNKLETQLTLFQNQKVGLVYSDVECFIESGEGISLSELTEEPDLAKHFRRGCVYHSLLHFNFIPTSSVVVRRDVLDRTGLFLEAIGEGRFLFGEDYELWLRIVKRSQVDFVHHKAVMHRMHQEQLSRDKARRYRQLCFLYRYLLYKKDSSERFVILGKYLENILKRAIASVVPV